ncbi:MAG: hypothetical protein QOF74_5455, partial [Caballeronia mineralivorans]|nr:hypothetical protein [Caballeronia mineralivorans]
ALHLPALWRADDRHRRPPAQRTDPRTTRTASRSMSASVSRRPHRPSALRQRDPIADGCVLHMDQAVSRSVPPETPARQLRQRASPRHQPGSPDLTAIPTSRATDPIPIAIQVMFRFVGRLPWSVGTSTLLDASGQASYNPKHLRTVGAAGQVHSGDRSPFDSGRSVL